MDTVILQKKIVQVLMQKMNIGIYDAYKTTIDMQKIMTIFVMSGKSLTNKRY